MFVCLFVCLFVYLFIYLYIYSITTINLFIYLFIETRLNIYNYNNKNFTKYIYYRLFLMEIIFIPCSIKYYLLFVKISRKKYIMCKQKSKICNRASKLEKKNFNSSTFNNREKTLFYFNYVCIMRKDTGIK